MKSPENTITGAGNSAAQFVTLKKGWGYWDVTSFPYGGSFIPARGIIKG